MKIDLTKFAFKLSSAIDIAEKVLLNVKPYHGVRIAILTNAMIKETHASNNIINSLTLAALLHDCALSEYLHDELSSSKHKELNMKSHCEVGENMLRKLPFYNDVIDTVKYHHECANGKGAFAKKASETPLNAQLIHLADAIDVGFSLYDCDIEKYTKILSWVNKNSGTIFSKECVDIFNKSINYELLESLSGENCLTTLNQILISEVIDISTDVLREMSSVFADITDYKSHFTWRHSKGIAEKAEIMGQYYNYSKEECDKLYVAGALHDIGKLLISDDILEKPAKLTPEEYKEIQNHAIGTFDLLHDIDGLEDICRWASLHHEKLDGSGYPFGYKAEDLDKNSRLLACLDIYQALVEDRPYKVGMSHDEAMNILNKMGNANQLDQQIINDIDDCFKPEISVNSNKNPAETQRNSNNTNEIIYRCPVCGYEYIGELPKDFICPRCEQPGSIFERK